VEHRWPSRDMSAPGLIRLAAAVRPLVGTRSFGTCATLGSDPTLWPAQCCSVMSCRLDSSVSVMIPDNVMWQDEAYVTDESHQNATHLICSH
jgi:hypothetical protein